MIDTEMCAWCGDGGTSNEIMRFSRKLQYSPTCSSSLYNPRGGSVADGLDCTFHVYDDDSLSYFAFGSCLLPSFFIHDAQQQKYW